MDITKAPGHIGIVEVREEDKTLAPQKATVNRRKLR
jgi:hypothetical protein